MKESFETRRGSIPLSRHDASRPRAASRHELLALPAHPPRSDTGGFIRVAYEGLRASNCEQAVLCIGIGQRTPDYSIGAEHLITVIEGLLEFRVGGEQVRIERLGQMFIPANTTYHLRNAGDVTAWFHNVRIRHDEWPYLPPVYKP